jgi:DNA-directed RNA polymerase subunit RPC12/RpoP
MSNQCIHCKRDTSFGSGLFVNRIPADDGYICPECGAYSCDRCEKPIAIDEDVGTKEVFGNSEGKSLPNEFSDGAYKVHEECLTGEERELLTLNNKVNDLTKRLMIQGERLKIEALQKKKRKEITNG